MPALLRAIDPTPFVTIQDNGRRGWRRFGVSPSGAMDRMSLAIANALVGNRPTEAALEFAHAAGEWQVDAASCRIAVAGGSFAITVDGIPHVAFNSITMTRGQRLRIGGAPDAVWGYLAIAGGLDIPLQFGSRSTVCVPVSADGPAGQFSQAMRCRCAWIRQLTNRNGPSRHPLNRPHPTAWCWDRRMITSPNRQWPLPGGNLPHDASDGSHGLPAGWANAGPTKRATTSSRTVSSQVPFRCPAAACRLC